MTPGELFRISLRILAAWILVRTLGQSVWAALTYYPSFNSTIGYPRFLASVAVAVIELGVGIHLLRSAARISAAFHFEPEELKQSAEIVLDTHKALQVGLQTLGILFLFWSISPAVHALGAWPEYAGVMWPYPMTALLGSGVYFLSGLMLLQNGDGIAARFETPRR